MANIRKNHDIPIRGGFLVRANEDRPNQDFFIPFLFNPRPLKFQDQVEYAEHKIPGRSDPLIQYLNGESQIITFTLIVEQLRIDEFKTQRKKEIRADSTTRPNVRTRQDELYDYRVPNLAQTDVTWLPDSAQEYVDMLQSLAMPRVDTNSFIRKQPPRLTLVWGKRLINTKIKRINVNEEEHYEDLNLEYALVDITLIRDDPTSYRRFRGKSNTQTSARLPRGMDVGEIRPLGQVRKRLGASYTWR